MLLLSTTIYVTKEPTKTNYEDCFFQNSRMLEEYVEGNLQLYKEHAGTM